MNGTQLKLINEGMTIELEKILGSIQIRVAVSVKSIEEDYLIISGDKFGSLVRHVNSKSSYLMLDTDKNFWIHKVDTGKFDSEYGMIRINKEDLIKGMEL